MATAVSWAAVSSRPQADKESLSDQHHHNHLLAEALGWEIVADLTVPGQSRSYEHLAEAQADVEAYRQLVALAESSAFQWIVCKSRDRLGRTLRLNREVSDLLSQHAVRVYSRAISPSNLDRRTESDVWGEGIEGALSEVEVMRLRERREMGMQARVRAGKMPGRPPWGFRALWEGGLVRWVFDDPVAEATIRFIVHSYHQGLSKITIADAANQRGMRTPNGRTWTLDRLDDTLLQPAYYGLVAFGKHRRHRRMPIPTWLVAPAQFTGPFTPDDWQRTLAEHERRKDEHPRSRRTPYPLTHIAWCAVCDLPMVGKSADEHRRYYRCTDYPRAWWGLDRSHPTHLVNARKLHRQLGERLRDLTLNPAQFDEIVARPDHDAGETERERERLAAQGADLAGRYKRWSEAYEGSVIDLPTYAHHVKELEAQETILQARIADLQALQDRDTDRARLAEELQAAAIVLPDLLAGDLTREDCERLRAIFTRLIVRVCVRDKVIERIDWRR